MSGGTARTTAPPQLSPVSQPLLRLFHAYLRWYTPRHFHGVRVAGLENFQRAPGGHPTIVILNHPGWWDPLVSMLLARHAWGSSVSSYAPMDAAALRQYGFFRRLGLFPVEMDSAAGARSFLRDAQVILSRPGHALWLTPQGHFQDVRLPAAFRGGLGALLHRLPGARVLPLAIEYTCWEERLPEALLYCAPPVDIADGPARSSAEWTTRMEAALTAAQAHLAALSVARDGSAFQNILRGAAGASRAYDLLRRTRAAAGGEAYQPEHSLVSGRAHPAGEAEPGAGKF